MSRIVHSTGILGAGMMGVAIAAVHVRRGLPVLLADADAATLATAPARIAEESEAPEAVQRLVRLADSDAAFSACDLVLESVIENLAAKQALYRRIEPHLNSNAILGTNTSTIPISQLAAGLREPGRFCGIHFFHPVRERPLVEIIRGAATSEATIATAVGYAQQIEKMPIVVGDGPGFLVNRLLVPYMNEALQLLLEGTSIEAVEQAAIQFGMAMGPLQLLDEIGLETALRGGMVVHQAFPERIIASPLLVAMIKAKGKFVHHRDPADIKTVDAIIAQWSQATAGPPLSPAMITDRLFLVMLLEATRIWEEGRVTDPRIFDLGVLFGLGFPQDRGGLFYWADTVGPAKILERLRALESLGPRFVPTPLVIELAHRHGRFYS